MELRNKFFFFLMAFTLVFVSSCSKRNDDISPNNDKSRFIEKIIKVRIRGDVKRDTCHIILKTFHETFTTSVDSIHFADLYSDFNLKDSIYFSIEKNGDLTFEDPIRVPKFDIPFKSGGNGMSAFNFYNTTRLTSYEMGATVPSFTSYYTEGFTATVGSIHNYTLGVGYVQKKFSADIDLVVEDNFGDKDTLSGHITGINRSEPYVRYSYNN